MRWPSLVMPSLFSCLLAVSPAITRGQFDETIATADSVRREQYLVLKAENTALQKFLTGQRGEAPDYFGHLLVDGQALIADEALNLEAIDWEQLKRDLDAIYLSKLVRQMDSPPKRALWIRSYFTDDPRKNSEFINWTFDGFARQSAGSEFVNVSYSLTTGGSKFWEKIDAIVDNHPNLVDENADETPKENEYVQVYPVRTFLSRLLTNNADCVVVIKPKFSDDFSDGLPRAVRTSMSVFSRQLQFDQKQRVLFSFSYSKDGENAKEWFVKEGAREMQALMGFQSSVITIGLQ